MYLLSSSLLCFITVTTCESDEVLLKLKKDVDKVGKGFENLIFHVVKKIVDDVGVYQDYYAGGELTTQHSVTKKILEGVENTTEEYDTEETAPLEHSNEILHNRLERSVKENSSAALNQSEEVKNDTTCTSPKADQITDLKEEIKKLYDLVVLLKDQQKIISFLDNNTKAFDGDVSRFGVGDMLKIIDYVNTKEDPRNKYSTKPKPDVDEMSEIRNDLKEAISTLNKTKHVLTMERKKELLLEKQLTDQKSDISLLKLMMGKLFKNTGNDILGAPQHLPRNLPVHRVPTEPTNLRRTLGNEESKPGTENGAELSELERLMRRLNQPKKTDIETKIFELQREAALKKRREDVLKQLKSLEKYLEPQKKDSEQTEDEGEGRVLDDEIELELQKLQEAIDNFQPHDEDSSSEPIDEERRQFQINLKKMFNKQNKGKGYDVKSVQAMLDRMSEEEAKRGVKNQGAKNNLESQIYKEQSLLLREIMELRKQLANSEMSRFGGGYNYGYTGVYGQSPLQTNFLNERFKNSGPSYPPYMNPSYQSQFFNLGAGPKQQYANLAPSNYPKPTYSPTYFNPSVQEFKKTLDGVPGLNNQYQSPLGPNDFNQQYQNLQEVKDFGSPVPPSTYNPDPNADFQPLTELREIPFTISVLPSHKAFNLETNSAVDGGHHQQDRNQFFPTPQEFFRPPGVTPGGSAGQSGAYTPKTAENVGHAYQTIEDLKAQITNLQNMIDGLSKPNYTQTLQDKETIAGLEKQISELKGVVNSINSDTLPKYAPLPPKADQTHVLPKLPGKTRRKKSIESNDLDGDSQLYDQVVSSLKSLIFKNENEIPNRNYEDLQNRIDDLRYQLETRIHSKNGGYSPTVSLNNYQPSYYQHNLLSHAPTTRHFEVGASKKNDVFTALVLKIVDKLIAATPAVIERLFGRGIGELGTVEGYGENDVQYLFKSLGVFGYGPLILLKLIDGLATFVKILKRNSFFKNFLTPASIVLLVAGAVIFLVWWLQPNEDLKQQPNEDLKQQPNRYDKYDEQYSKYNYRKGYGSNNNDYGYKGSYTPADYLGNDKRRGGWI